MPSSILSSTRCKDTIENVHSWDSSFERQCTHRIKGATHHLNTTPYPQTHITNALTPPQRLSYHNAMSRMVGRVEFPTGTPLYCVYCHTSNEAIRQLYASALDAEQARDIPDRIPALSPPTHEEPVLVIPDIDPHNPLAPSRSPSLSFESRADRTTHQLTGPRSMWDHNADD